MLAALRLPFSAVSGAAITLSFFTLLWHLVGARLDIEPSRPATEIQFKRLRADTPIELKRVDKVERPPPAQLPALPSTARPAAAGPLATFVKTRFEPARLAPPGAQPPRPDGDIMPIIRPSPEYPDRAAANGIQGWVHVRFAVSTIGTVRDAVIVAAEPPKVFDAAALKAIARWRYNPKVENGVAVERVGLETIIRFELDQ